METRKSYDKQKENKELGRRGLMGRQIMKITIEVEKPEWANFIAQDIWGNWWFYEEMPVKTKYCWMNDPQKMGKWEVVNNPNWQKTLKPV